MAGAGWGEALVAGLADAIAVRAREEEMKTGGFETRPYERSLLAGIAGAQGTGKTTLARALIPALAERGLHAAAISLDDFYLTLAEREQLGRAVHPLLAIRGMPGTHDLALAHAVLDQLQRLPAGTTVDVPRFDKAAAGNRRCD